MIQILINVLNVIEILLFGYFILSWFPMRSGSITQQLWLALDKIFGPILAILRKRLPRTGMIDLSGMVLIIGLIILQSILRSQL